MYNFLPYALLAYALNGGAIIIDKILLRTAIGNPYVYTFYIALLGILALVFIPFGLILNQQTLFFSIISAIFGNFALLSFFQGLKYAQASLVGPVVGGLNPLFTLIIGVILFNQLITTQQLLAFFVLLLGAGILTFNIWGFKLKANTQTFMIILSALSFGVSSIFLKEAFQSSNFVTGLVLSRAAAGVFVLAFLIPKDLRFQIINSKISESKFINKTTLLLLSGQSMGAAFGLLWAYGISLGNPALVNSLFGMQYLVILTASLILGKKNPEILDEKLTPKVLIQKTTGVAVLSLGLYLLSR